MTSAASRARSTVATAVPRTTTESTRTWRPNMAAPTSRSRDAAGHLGPVTATSTRTTRVMAMRALLAAATVRLTHSYVLAELVALCNSRNFDRRLTLDFVAQI